MIRRPALHLWMSLLLLHPTWQAQAQEPVAGDAAESLRPNMVFIMADDMGYGDVQSQNPRSTIPTPNLDRLAAQGMRFTDAHSGSAVCTPTRYGVLTGRYAWRSRLKSGVLGGYSAPLIEADRPTVASMLREQGYSTAAIGKWHLGMEMARHDGENPKEDRWEGDGNVDFTKPIAEGPTTRGFDTFFGISASFDMAPYVWIEDDHFTMRPTIQFPGSRFPAFARKGPQSEDVVFTDALDVLAARAAAFVLEQAKQGVPFFLYLPLTGPHKPVVPHARFVGKSKLGPYGDFIMNVDDTVGKVLAAIDKAGAVDNTLVIFTSDNGSYMFRLDAEAADHVDDPVHQGYRSEHHTANGDLRGTKADVWEGGHRVPFLARWPRRIKAGGRCDETICHTDFFATAAHAAGAPRSPGVAEDSYSALPLMTSSPPVVPRPPVINHSAAGMFAIRDGKWKLVAGNGSGGRQKPHGKPFAEPFQLFDLASDPGETTNVIEAHPEVAARLRAQLEELRGED